MPYGDFVNREDVYKIIAQTLSNHYGFDIQIVDKNKKTNPAHTMFCFKRLGIIIPPNPNDGIKEQVKREYKIENSVFKKIIMCIYICFVFFAPTVLCDKKLVFSSGGVNSDILIEPGNKKIKIIDFKSKTIHNIIKEGFGSEWIEKEIEFRSNNNKEYIMPLRKTSEGYVEKLHVGYCFTRLNNSIKSVLNGKVDKIITDYSLVSESIDANIYINQIKSKIEKYLQNFDLINADKLINLLNRIANIDQLPTITLCLSHGDLQPGNLFYDIEEKNVYLIDWETWKNRSQWYDMFLFYYGFRNSTKLIENINYYLIDDGIKIFGSGVTRSLQIKTLLIFFVEDILWQFDEMSVLPQGCFSNGINEYLKEDNIKRIDALIDEVVL